MVELDPRLLALAKENQYRITSGTGGTHNVGSLHGSGLAIDIDHRGVDFNQLQQRVKAVGGRVLDERTRPKGQKVWGGPHFHIELPKQAAQKAIEVGQLAKQVERPEIDPRDYSMNELLDLAITGQGFPKTKPAIKAISVPTSEIKRPEVKQAVEADQQVQQFLSNVDDRIAREAAQKAQQPAPSADVGILTELGAGFANPLTGYTRDVAAQNLAGRPAYEIGQLAGNLTGFLGGGLIGGVPGTVATGAALSGGAELQRQRLAGEQTNVGKALGAGAIGGGLSALPVFGAGGSALRRTALNAAVQGGAEAAGSVVQQGIEQGTFTPNIDIGRTITQAGIGGAGGGLAGALGTRAPKLPEKALEARPSLYAPRVELAPEALPVQPRTPSVRETLELGNTIEVPTAGSPRREVVQTPAVEPQPFAVPAEPVVRDVDYTPETTGKLQPELSPEQQQSLVDLEAQKQARLNQAREGGSPSATGRTNENQQTAVSFEASKRKREIVQGDSLQLVEGGLTEQELIAKRQKLETNYTGKPVIVDGQTGTVENVAFGKVKVRLDNGQTVSLKPVDVKPAETLPPLKADKPPRPPKAPKDGVDAAFYDLGTNPADERALAAAREALPGYGDENLKAIGQRVRQAYDGLDGQDVIPGSIVKKAIQPEVPPSEAVQGMKPKPKTPEQVINDGKMLRGDRAAMEAQGVQGSIVKNRAEYKALRDYQKSLPSIGANRATNFEALTPDVVTQRLREQLMLIESGTVGTNQMLRASIPRSLERLESGNITPAQFRKAQRDMVDMDLRIEKQNVQDQINQVHPSLRDAWELEYDEKTGVGRQKSSKVLTLAEVEDALTDDQYNLAKTLEVVADNDGRIRLDADTEITGATSRVGEKELSPIGFMRTKDNYVAVQGYNEEGHLVNYYITPKPNENGQFSKINRLGDVVNQPAFRGEYANIYKGIREFNIDDIMSRPVRADGRRTSELLEAAGRVSELAKRADIMAANPQFAKKLQDFMDNPRAATVKTVNDMEELLKTDPKLLKRMCTLLGKVS